MRHAREGILKDNTSNQLGFGRVGGSIYCDGSSKASTMEVYFGPVDVANVVQDMGEYGN